MTQEEKEILERGQANLAKMDIAPEQPKTRAERSDKGKPRLFVDVMDGAVRFDIGAEAGRTAFFAWVTADGGRAEQGIEQLLAIVDRLLKKHGVQ